MFYNKGNGSIFSNFRLKTAALAAGIFVYSFSYLGANTYVVASENSFEEYMQSEDWSTVIVNFENEMDKDYVPELQSVGGGHYFDKRASDSLVEMIEAAQEEGLSPIICSSYRTWEKQTQLYKRQVNNELKAGRDYDEALKVAAMSVASPGTSEHQLGIAVDIISPSYQYLDRKQEETEEAKWLFEHCAEYGFILRYPDGKTDITKVIYEPWHYRYVGVEAAKVIMESGITLEEYVEGDYGFIVGSDTDFENDALEQSGSSEHTEQKEDVVSDEGIDSQEDIDSKENDGNQQNIDSEEKNGFTFEDYIKSHRPDDFYDNIITV